MLRSVAYDVIYYYGYDDCGDDFLDGSWSCGGWGVLTCLSLATRLWVLSRVLAVLEVELSLFVAPILVPLWIRSAGVGMTNRSFPPV